MKDHINQFYCRNTGWLERPLLDNSKNISILEKTPKHRQKIIGIYLENQDETYIKISDIIHSVISLVKGVTSVAFCLVLDIFTKLEAAV